MRDTDSTFSTEPLPAHLVGDGLGMMKDELKGGVIEQAYFLGIKKYGYWIKDPEGNRIEHSVIAGVKRDSVSFSEIIDLYNGKVITKQIPSVFNKNLSTLDIKISNAHVTIDFVTDKQLLNNKYVPQTIYDLNNPFAPKQNFLNKLVKKAKFWLKSKVKGG